MYRTLFFSFAVLIAGLVTAPAHALCREGTVELRGDWGTARFRVDVADDSRERAQGLMHVEEMGRLRGMLFIYERPQRVSFWMENTLIPLDMIFMNPAGEVLNIHSNAIPLDRTPIPGGHDDILYVLEVNGGVAEDFGIYIGSEMRHISIPAEQAVWPCEE